jgi:alpha-D-ribose 1-methylphosphonate 5-triphosphate diphosphatase PhnM
MQTEDHMKDHERLTDAVKTVCEEQGISIIELAEQMPGWATNEQLSRWMHDAKRPHEWKREAINEFFNRKIYK